MIRLDCDETCASQIAGEMRRRGYKPTARDVGKVLRAFHTHTASVSIVVDNWEEMETQP